jgi:hypothetical protein
LQQLLQAGMAHGSMSHQRLEVAAYADAVSATDLLKAEGVLAEPMPGLIRGPALASAGRRFWDCTIVRQGA